MSSDLSKSDVVFVSAGTDGVDGNSPAAGAWTDGNTVAKASGMNLSIDEFLADCNSFQFFKTLDQSIVTGPTGTNVMDLYIRVERKTIQVKWMRPAGHIGVKVRCFGKRDASELILR